MKKFFLSTLTALAALFLMSFTNNSNMDQQENSYEFCFLSSASPVTVYKITIVGRNGAAAKKAVQAEFDKDNMELHVVEGGKTMTYSVVQNPYKGYSDDARGGYDYYAGGYYF